MIPDINESAVRALGPRLVSAPFRALGSPPLPCYKRAPGETSMKRSRDIHG